MNWDWEKLKAQQSKGPVPPQMDEIFQKFKKIKFPGGPLLILIIFLVFLGSSTFYTVDVDEVGVIQRFGRYIRISQPGLNFKLPSGIEKVTKVKVRRVYMEEFGFRAAPAGQRTVFSAPVDDATVSLMLTGDLNVAEVPWIVQYRVKDPYNYLFKSSRKPNAAERYVRSGHADGGR
jgi:membrane protease subunit HflK